ncbi:MAG: 30S ribosomal protein S8 [candidate division Zixibacteria bacterium HGW-Zixibacteria-1]|nr:ribosomal protein S8 [uncultured bacterium]PKK84593.1 MAG: 30S ribosomal protein S8 [candidate division Zixibacteria bacterium HGW-Zixibacteria-1]
MSMTDPISDMLTRIRNASKAKMKAVNVPASNIKLEVAKILKNENFIKDILEIPDKRQGILRLYLKYSRDDAPIIRGLKRISRPGLRKYYNLEDLKKIRRTKVGITIVSTSQGIMTDGEALKKNVGGEALCNVW